MLTSTGSGAYTLTEQDGTVTAYNADGTLDYVQDTNGNTITAGYTGGLLTSLTASCGQSFTLAYNAAGLIPASPTPPAATTTYTTTRPTSTCSSVMTSTARRPATPTTPARTRRPTTPCCRRLPDGTHDILAYDARGRLASTSDGNAEPTTFAYAGGAVAATDAIGNTTTYFFDNRGLLVKVVDPSAKHRNSRTTATST